MEHGWLTFRWLSNVALLGGLAWVVDFGRSAVRALLSLYHLALPFVLIWMVWRLGYDPAA
ncbi:MAG: hypothetical protein ACQETK_05910 [Pseudomonadota bacterium]